jgi:eukaryotic-like serine/threonine-protein kinase
MKDGSLVADRFEIVSLATSGGMGTVYRARDRLTGERVALKMVQQCGVSEVGRFLREGKALAELHHPAIVRYVAHGVTPQGFAYIAMEWLDGEDLGERLHRGSLGIRESVSVVSRAAEGLAFAHSRGLVHRDVKPSNLFLVDGDLKRVKVLDFGIVRQAHVSSTELTRTGAMLGTPGFMAPEQVRGSKDVDARADVFALGCVLYKCLTGSPPFASDDPIVILTRVLFEDVAPPRTHSTEIPPELDALVCRLLTKDPAGRPSDAGALLVELAELSLSTSSSGVMRPVQREAITGREQRLLSIVLAGASRGLQIQRDATLTAAAAVSIEARMRARIEALGGRFESLANDSFVVMCGGQGTPREQAMQAARCALAVREFIPDAPIAVATGRTDASVAMPVGEVVERAARLLRGASEALDQSEPTISDLDSGAPAELTPPSQAARLVRVDDVTAALLGPRFDITGEADALVLVRERDAGESDHTVLGKATSCVGRERELALLAGMFEQCVAESMASVVLVTAPAGVGKSRLRHEFVRKLHKIGTPAQVWMGRGDPMSAGAPFAILSQALATTMDLTADEPLAARRAKVEQRVMRHVSPEDAARVIDFLGELLGVPFPDEASVQLRAARKDPMLMGDQMRRAWEDFLAAECRAQPVLLVLEDLHWGDLPTVRFVDAALRRLAELPFMVLAVARPEIEELFPKLWSERRVQPLPLGELTARAAERLVREVLGARASNEDVVAIVERAGGNAFYIEELIRTVAEGRSGALPESVLAMTQARLDSLDPEARRVLRAASVFGRSFWASGVESLLGSSPARASGLVEGWLSTLVEREVLAKMSQSRFAPEEELFFRNALLREASYAMLTDKDRAVGHKLAGQWLEAHGETEPLVLAQHFELGGDGAHAVAWYRRAAEQALEGNDFAAMIERAERGAACGAEGEVLGALRTLQVEGHFWRGEPEGVDQRGAEALALLPPGSLHYQRALARMIISSGRRVRTERVTELAGLLVGALEAGLVTREAEGACVFALAHAAAQLLFLGLYDLVGPLVMRAGRIALSDPGRDDPALAGWADDARSSLAMREGDMGACVMLMASASRHFLAAGDLRQVCVEDGYVGYGFMDLGAYEESERVLRECIERAERLGLPHVVASAQHNLGLTCGMLGQVEEARRLLYASIGTFVAHEDRRLECAARRYLSRVLVIEGDLEAAEGEARRALSLGPIGPQRAAALGTVASVLLARGKGSEALVYATEAHATLAQLGPLDADDAEVRRPYAEALYVTGNVIAARTAIVDACRELLRRAAKISNQTWRQSFLERRGDHARVFGLAKAWSVEI